jgi:hypothetical protein
VLTVRAVTKDDFDQVYPLLQRIPAPIAIPRETWRKLFETHWDKQAGPLGYALVDEQKIVGYLGLITVGRDFRGKRFEVTDMSSWTVDPGYGGYALKILCPFIQDHNKALISFAPSKTSDAIFRRFGFQELNANLYVIPFWNGAFRRDHEIEFDMEGQRALLSKEDWQIYTDHYKFSSAHFVIKHGQSYCYVVARRVLKKRLPFLHIHYVSDKKRFARTIRQFTGTLCRRFRVWGLVGFQNYLGDQAVPGSLKMEMSSKPLFRGANLKPEDIDSLYSEYFLLDF